MTDMAPPMPTLGTIELPDPRGPINEDFKRGACYTARIIAHPPYMMKGAIITITIPNGHIECGKVPAE